MTKLESLISALIACTLTAVIGYGIGYYGTYGVRLDDRYVAREVLEHASDACLNDVRVTADLNNPGDTLTTPSGNDIQPKLKPYLEYRTSNPRRPYSEPVIDIANKYLSQPVEEGDLNVIYIMHEPVTVTRANTDSASVQAIDTTLTCLINVADVAGGKTHRDAGLQVYTTLADQSPL